MKEKILFKRNLFKAGNYSIAIRLPLELMDILKWKVGNEVGVFLNGDGIAIERLKQ